MSPPITPMMHIPPLFADVDWVRLAIFVVVGVAYLISFIASRLRDRQIAKNRVPKPVRRNDETAKELEDFLKKSAAGRREAAPKPARPVTPVRQPESRGRPPRRKADERVNRKSDDRDKRRKAEAPAATLVNLRESNLTKNKAAEPAGPLRPSIDTHQFAERAEHLGSFDEARSLQNRLQQTFSRQAGTLAEAAEAPANNLASQNRAAAAAAAATGTKQTLPIAALLSGGNLRNAVILNEIFQRPEDRW